MSKAPILTFLTQEGLKLKEISNLLQTSSKGAATLLFHLNSFPLGTCTSTSTSVLSFYTLVYISIVLLAWFLVLLFLNSLSIYVCVGELCVLFWNLFSFLQVYGYLCIFSLFSCLNYLAMLFLFFIPFRILCLLSLKFLFILFFYYSQAAFPWFALSSWKLNSHM